MHQLKSLPWQVLVNTSAITIGLVTGLDYGLSLLLPPASQIQVVSMFSSPLRLLYSAAVDAVIGILGVMVLEKLIGPRPSIYLSTLWALILCLLMALVVRSLMPIPGVFLSQLHQISIVGILVGVFGKSQRYWR
ncbi:hypothetical protein [Acaryochloris sp. IP29b_bin.137]|uniref:hypothetical protein n=1 Tax=Acaryochloris sp. IP29b_bin.137 TaxID=2969217 RepID=UPI0026356F99|nr:hypothetical protein [Acaryochloris sp. IP29b_bin.137]